MIDHLDQTIVEISVRVTEIHLGALEQGIEAPVDIRKLHEVCAGQKPDQGVVTVIVVAVEREFVAAIEPFDQ